MPYQVWIEGDDRRPTKVGEPHALRGDALDMLHEMTDDWREVYPGCSSEPHPIAAGHRFRGDVFDLVWVQVF